MKFFRPNYALEFDEEGVFRLTREGRVLALARQAAVCAVGSPDAGTEWEGPSVRQEGGAEVLEFRARRTRWEDKRLLWTLRDDELLVEVRVRGRGELDTLLLFAGLPDAFAAVPGATAGHFRRVERDPRPGWRASPFGHREVFNPQPNAWEEQELPASCSRRITCATTFGPVLHNTFFAPAPYAYVFDGVFSLGLVGRPGERTYNHWDYAAGNGWGLALRYDGMSGVAGEWTGPAVRIGFGRSAFDSLEGYAAALRDRGLAPRTRPAAPRWAEAPIACGWGEQVALCNREKAARLETDSPLTGGAASFATQAVYEGIVRRLRDMDWPYGTLIVDLGWSECLTLPSAHPGRWPDLKGFIRDRHAEGRKVLLWLGAWNPGGLDPALRMPHEPGCPDACDPTNPEFRRRLAEAIRECVSPGGFDADGFKLDFTGDLPRGPGYRPAGRLWGFELVRDYVGQIRDAMKEAKEDSVLETHCASPEMADLSDVIRLNDIFCARLDVRPMMEFRAKVARIAVPGCPLDTDNSPFASLDSWMDYMRFQPRLGIPSAYVFERMELPLDGRQQAIGPERIAEVRAIWTDYVAALRSRP